MNIRNDLFNIFRNFSNPRTPAHGEGAHRAGSHNPVSYRRSLKASRKRERQARKYARRITQGRKHIR